MTQYHYEKELETVEMQEQSRRVGYQRSSDVRPEEELDDNGMDTSFGTHVAAPSNHRAIAGHGKAKETAAEREAGRQDKLAAMTEDDRFLLLAHEGHKKMVARSKKALADSNTIVAKFGRSKGRWGALVKKETWLPVGRLRKARSTAAKTQEVAKTVNKVVGDAEHSGRHD